MKKSAIAKCFYGKILKIVEKLSTAILPLPSSCAPFVLKRASSESIFRQVPWVSTYTNSWFIEYFILFRLLQDETKIYVTGGELSEDFRNLLNAAHKAVDLGYCVYILPNPKVIRTADFIIERKGVYKMYDLKLLLAKVL